MIRWRHDTTLYVIIEILSSRILKVTHPIVPYVKAKVIRYEKFLPTAGLELTTPESQV